MYKRLIWILFLILSGLILIYPVHLEPVFYTIQGVHIFQSLTTFCIIFIIWFILLLFLILKGNQTEQVFALCAFGLIFLGFWVLKTPYGGTSDSIFNFGHVAYIEKTGHIIFNHPNLVYFEFPVLHIEGATVSEICGISVTTMSVLFLMFNSLLFVISLYLLFQSLLKNSLQACLAVLFTIIASVVLPQEFRIFYPRTLSYSLLCLFLFVLIKALKFRYQPYAIILVLLISVMILEYFPVPALLILILISMFLVTIINHTFSKNGYDQLPIILIFFVVGFISWELYVATNMFGNILSMGQSFSNNISSMEFFSIKLLATSTLGIVPLWAKITRITSWILLLLAGVLIWLITLFKIKRISYEETFLVAGLCGTGLLEIFSILGSQSGIEFARFLLYAPFFCAPLVVKYFADNSRKYFAIIISIILFCLSLPSFLSSVHLIATDAWYPSEYAAGATLSEITISSNTRGFYLGSGAIPWVYYFPDSEQTTTPRINTETQLRQYTKDIVTQFEEYPNNAYFTWSERALTPYENVFQIKPDDILWKDTYNTLNLTDRIYDNGTVEIYYNQVN